MKNPSSLINEKKKYHTDKFTLHLEPTGRWRVNGRDFEGKYRRIRFDAKDLNEAMKKAEEILDYGLETTENHSTHNEFPQIQIADALLRASNNRNWTDYTRTKDQVYCDIFLEWIDQKQLVFWHELDYEKILEYKHELIAKGLAYDTIRLYLVPIRRTARWMAAQWPRHYFNFCESIRLTRDEVFNSEYDESGGNPYLPMVKILDFLDWLSRPIKGKQQSIRDQIAVGVSLQGIAGLQLQEAFRLQAKKFDSATNTITIDMEVKNRYRIRRIPVADVVCGLLRRMYPDDPESRFIHSFAAFNEYSKAVKRTLHEWDPSVVLKPKDLRNTLQTEAIDNGWYGYYVQRYVGHAPKSIGERHYHGDQNRRMVDFYREKVVSHVEKIIQTWDAPQDTILLQSPRLVVNQ